MDEDFTEFVTDVVCIHIQFFISEMREKEKKEERANAKLLPMFRKGS